MAVANFISAIDTKLPATPLLREVELQRLLEEFQLVYQAIQILQVNLSQLRLDFDAYVATHP